MSVKALNENLFAQSDSYYVLVEEDKMGVLRFVSNPFYSTRKNDPYFDYQVTRIITHAYDIYDGDPVIEAMGELAPHLHLYKVNPTYEFEYIDKII